MGDDGVYTNKQCRVFERDGSVRFNVHVQMSRKEKENTVVILNHPISSTRALTLKKAMKIKI